MNARGRTGLAVVALMLIAAACGDAGPTVPPGVEIADGFVVEVVLEGFDRPTQLAVTATGDYVIGELAGGENDATGQLVLVSATDTNERVILQEGLDKPTGVAVIGDDVWVMERDQLIQTTLEPGAERVVVAGDLPNNGRSQGTLTVTPDGGLLFDTSGRKRGSERTEGSATLFRVDDPSLGAASPITAVATGFKHAYAHTFTDDGRLWSVEMTDGNFDGVRASDELLQIEPGDDAGWPFCVDDNRPVVEFGGTEASCADVPRSHALFAPGATPTDVVVAPWDAGTLLVALWIPGTVVAVPVESAAAPHEGEVIVSGIESPQALFLQDEQVWVVDHETGSVFAITARS